MSDIWMDMLPESCIADDRYGGSFSLASNEIGNVFLHTSKAVA